MFVFLSRQLDDFQVISLTLFINAFFISPRSGEYRSEFLSYQGTFRGRCSGKLDTEASSISMSLEGRGSSRLQSSFDKLEKVGLNVKDLLRDSANR